ncbi:uncharacterized protein N7483_002183 [Penicillium malachiteum]|uniref:uncharacterized protein n=1 Tax=Penicillium malachiteum TaxID=1324776 RepID=UPI002549143B|nr:uncharacterized protein N7483_002183 [Penicillium malachiteum]KAJ5737058.1 hypothetical protein N7483_002183 [Penicillium malachiteum]
MSVQKFRELNKRRNTDAKPWTMTHAFFADMGGFLLDGPGIDIPFPIDAEQLLFLVEKGYVEYPSLSREDIEDRNKSDGLARFITICQAVWFLVNCIVRGVQHLTITTIELTTVAFVIVFFFTSFCWYYKPLDLSTTTTLTVNTNIDQIQAENSPYDHQDYYTNPLDFIYSEVYLCGIFWRYFNQILLKVHLPLFSRAVHTKPYNRIPSDNFLPLDITAELITPPVIILFGSMFMFAWNFHFPSVLEQTRWRTSSICTLCFSIFGQLAIKYLQIFVMPKVSTERQILPSWMKKIQESWVSQMGATLRNIHPSKDPRLDIPLRALIPYSALCALYCVCRAYILIEDFIGLRSLPVSAFQTISWSVYVPHL